MPGSDWLVSVPPARGPPLAGADPDPPLDGGWGGRGRGRGARLAAQRVSVNWVGTEQEINHFIFAETLLITDEESSFMDYLLFHQFLFHQRRKAELTDFCFFFSLNLILSFADVWTPVALRRRRSVNTCVFLQSGSAATWFCLFTLNNKFWIRTKIHV